MGLPPLPRYPLVTVVMPVRSPGSFIECSLGVVLDQHGVVPPQVIVVDGHSADGTPARVRQVAAGRWASVTLVDNEARIVPVSMNLGLAGATGGDVIVRVDGHCVVAPDYLRRCLEALRATGAECVGGPYGDRGRDAGGRSHRRRPELTLRRGRGGVPHLRVQVLSWTPWPSAPTGERCSTASGASTRTWCATRTTR